MNERINKFLLTGDKFNAFMPRSTYIVCGSFTKNKERIQKFKQTVDSRYIYDTN